MLIKSQANLQLGYKGTSTSWIIPANNEKNDLLAQKGLTLKLFVF